MCLFSQAATDLIVDVNGMFPAGSSFSPLVPARLLDTRAGGATVDRLFAGIGQLGAGGVLELQVGGRGGVAADAAAVALNVTVTGPAGGGYVTVWPCGQTRPNASNLNYTSGQTVPNAVLSQVGVGGKVCLFSQAATDLIVDANGMFASSSSSVAPVPSTAVTPTTTTTTVSATTTAPPTTTTTTTVPAAPPNGLMSGQTLFTGAVLSSSNHNFELAMQGDGNLVLYDTSSHPFRALWSTGTSGAGNTVTMQGDGNLVVYSSARSALWSSGTSDFSGATLALQDDGNLVIYLGSQALWTYNGPLYNRLLVGQTLQTAHWLASSNHNFELAMQGDGNLVLYDTSSHPFRALWSTGTSGAGNTVTMQGDGNLVVYSSARSALWSSGTSGSAGATLALQDDGNLVIYLGSHAIWTYSGSGPAGGGSSASEIAQGQIGVAESPDGSGCNKFTFVLYGAGSFGCPAGLGSKSAAWQWCSDFATWVWQQAGANIAGLTSQSGSFYTYGKAHGTWHAAGSGYAPRPGDAVLYALNTATATAEHVGIVVSSGKSPPDVVQGNWGDASYSHWSVRFDAGSAQATNSYPISGYASPAT